MGWAAYLRLFGQENIGRPDLEAESEIKSVTNYLNRIMPVGSQVPDIHAALLFTDIKVELSIENPPLPAMTPKDLKEFFKDKAKETPLSGIILDSIRKNLPQPEKEEE